MEMKQGAHRANTGFGSFCWLVNLSLPLCVLILTVSIPLLAGNPQTRWEVKAPFEQKLFVENKGQFTLPDSLHSGPVLFGASLNGLDYYFSIKGIWVKNTVTEEIKPDKDDNKDANKGSLPEEEMESMETVTREQFHQITFPGSSENAALVPELLNKEEFTYGAGKNRSIRARAFERLVYRNLFAGIDMEFEFPKDKPGFKYSFTIHPGAKVSSISMSYPLSRSVGYTAEGNLLIQSLFGCFTDHSPKAWEVGTGKMVSCSFYLKKGNVTFNTGDYDPSQTLLIDPWTTSPPAFAIGKGAYDVDWDNAGNCYIYGGGFPFQVIKYNPGGTPVWTYTTTFTGTKKRYGDFAVDHRSGSVYIVEGYNPVTGAGIIKLNTAGNPVGNFGGDLSFTEMWRISFSSCTSQLVIAGGGITTPSYTACYVDTSLTSLSPVNVLNSPTGYHDMWGLAADNSGNCYMATARSASSPGAFDNILYSLPLPALSPITWQVPSGYMFVETFAVNYTPGSITGYSNGYNGMSMGGTGLYTYDSHVLGKWNTSTGASMGTVTVNGPIIKNARSYGGITSDNCDHVFLGFGKNIQQYNSLSFVSAITAPDTLYDLSLGQNNLLYACGKGFVSCFTVSLPSCAGIKVKNHIQSCVSPATDSLEISGGKAPYTILWNTTPIQTGPVAINLTPGTYIATIHDDACNVNTVRDTVVIPPSVMGSIVPVTQNVTCNGGSNGSISLQVTGISTPLPAFAWSNGMTGQNVNNLTAGNYTVTVTGANGCTQSLPIQVIQPMPIRDSLLTRGIRCNGDTSGISIAVTGGTPSYQVTWNTIPVQTGFHASGLSAGTYSGTVTDLNGCKTNFSTVLTDPPKLLASVTAQDTGCGGNSGKASANVSGGTGAYTYSWNPGGGSMSSLINLVPGTYTVTVTDSNGCHTTATTVLNSGTPLTISFTSKDSSGCAPVCVNFTPSLPAGTTVSWNFGDQTSSSSIQASHCYNTAGIYAVTLTASKGNCTQIVTHPNMIKVYPHPNASFTVLPSLSSGICFSHNTALDSGMTLSYLWTFGDVQHNTSTIPNPCFQYGNPGKYCVNLEISNTYGCRDSSEHCMEVTGEVELYVPNSFTPNGDGLNDVFKPVGEGIDPAHYDFMIFDRWGQLLWETHQWGTGWDGRVSNGGDVVQEDVYVWKIDCWDINENPHHLIGRVSLVK